MLASVDNLVPKVVNESQSVYCTSKHMLHSSRCSPLSTKEFARNKIVHENDLLDVRSRVSRILLNSRTEPEDSYTEAL